MTMNEVIDRYYMVCWWDGLIMKSISKKYRTELWAVRKADRMLSLQNCRRVRVLQMPVMKYGPLACPEYYYDTTILRKNVYEKENG